MRLLRARRHRSVRRVGLIVTAVVAVVVFVACDPVLHPTFTVKEDPSGSVTFQLLSGNGAFVVVRSSGAGVTVPSAGCWRVRRSDGSVDALPACDSALAVSADGSRILLATSGGTVLWSSGSTLNPPPGTVFSKDLTFGVFVDTAGAVKTWSSADQSIGLVETAFPRPQGTTGARADGISNDGRKVDYALLGSTPIERFVDLDTNAKVDRPDRSSRSCDLRCVDDRFSLAASGAGFLERYEATHLDSNSSPPMLVIDESWAELVAFPSGTVIRRYTNTTQESIQRTFISNNGGTAWVYQQHGIAAGPDCQRPPPPLAFCVTASTTVLIANFGTTSFDTGPNPVGTMGSYGNGRFVVYDKSQGEQGFGLHGPVTILDWFTHHVETLSSAVNYTESSSETCMLNGAPIGPCTLPANSTNGQVSDDLSVVATSTTTGKGWYEYSTSH